MELAKVRRVRVLQRNPVNLRFGLHIGLDVNYSNSYEHVLYIYKSGQKKKLSIVR